MKGLYTELALFTLVEKTTHYTLRFLKKIGAEENGRKPYNSLLKQLFTENQKT